MQLQLFDLLGRQCWSGSLTNVQPGATDNTLDLKEVAAGHYILHVQSGTQVLQQSLIVAAD